MYPLIKTVLFSLPPERAHDLMLTVARVSPSLGSLGAPPFDPRLEISVGTHRWRSPVGLAAGLDKNAEALDFFANQGFGALECGTLTLRSQLGNPKPRIWRYVEEQSLRNAMGFPNSGMATALPLLRRFHRRAPLGINLGMNKDSGMADSIRQLTTMLTDLRQFADYFVVNVSSPNTPGLRALQEKSYLTELFAALNEVRGERDLFLKIAPDLSSTQIHDLAQLVVEKSLTGIIATNTTANPERGPGGISGGLLRERSRVVRKQLFSEHPDLEVIGVGGIASFDDVLDLWADGGKAFQVYTAYIFQGPALLKLFYAGMSSFLHASGLGTLHQFFSLALADRRSILEAYRGK